MQPRRYVAARLRNSILYEIEEAFSVRSRRRECVATSAMARNARPRHGLLATTVHINRQASRTGSRVERVELREIGATVGAGGDFDGVRALVLTLVFHNGCVEVDAAVGITCGGLDKIILHVRGHGAVWILPEGQIAAVTQIAHIAEDDVYLRAGAAAEAVRGLPFVERIFLVVRVHCGVVSLSPHGRRGLHRTVRLHLRIGEGQKFVRRGLCDNRLRRRCRRDVARTATATAASAEQKRDDNQWNASRWK